MIYQTGTITTTAGQTKIKGAGTRWKDNLAGISEGCPISYLINNVVYMNTVLSVNSDTEINLTYPVPVAASAAKYQIATFVLDSMSDGVRKMLANQQYIDQFLRNMDTWMTQDGIVEIKTPTGETVRLESIIALKKLIDGKFDKSGGVISKDGECIVLKNSNDKQALFIAFKDKNNTFRGLVGAPSDLARIAILNSLTGKSLALTETGSLTYDNKVVMLAGDYGLGARAAPVIKGADFKQDLLSTFFRQGGGSNDDTITFSTWGAGVAITYDYNRNYGLFFSGAGNLVQHYSSIAGVLNRYSIYSTANTTKDANGNLKAASPIIKLFADSLELNDESEGVEMEHIGIGHYLIKGVVGFNADGAWGVNNGFVIPQDHNGKNMVLIDYEVRPDGDIEVFVFHQQNAEMPERFQNKRIKYFDEEGKPVYFENYEPCDIPESRWIDMRVEMPPNSLYNQKLAEAERLAKIEAERVAQEEEAERVAKEEAEKAVREVGERKKY